MEYLLTQEEYDKLKNPTGEDTIPRKDAYDLLIGHMISLKKYFGDSYGMDFMTINKYDLIKCNDEFSKKIDEIFIKNK